MCVFRLLVTKVSPNSVLSPHPTPHQKTPSIQLSWSATIGVYHCSLRQPRALWQIIHTPQEYAKSYEWPIYHCQGSSPTPSTHTHPEWDGVEMRFGPGCQRSSPGECAESCRGTPSRPWPLPVADKANLQRQHLSPPQFPNLHAVTHPPNSCQKPYMRVPERPSSTWSLSFLSPSESPFICWQHATEHVHSEGAFSFLHTNKSLSDNHHTSIHLQLTN